MPGQLHLSPVGEIQRRQFIRVVGIGGLGLVLGCNKSTEPEGNPFDDYIPLVDQTYPPADFFFSKDVSNSFGSVGFYDRRKSRIYSAYFIVEGGSTPIEGLEAELFNEYNHGIGGLLVTDPQRRYLPSLFGLQALSGPSFLGMFPRERFTEILERLFITKLQENLPSPQYDCSKIDSVPLMIYRGDWSLDDVQRLTNLMEKAALVLSFLDGGQVYSILSKAGNVLDGLGYALDLINILYPESKPYVGRSIKYPIYTPFTSIGPQHLIMSTLVCRSRVVSEDIKYLLPINEGNVWTYSSQGQYGTIEVVGEREIKGKDLLVVRNTGGIEEYYGFYGGSLTYHGISHPSVGNIFFDPAIVVGNSAITKRSTFQTNSRVISSNAEISGTVEEIITWSEREDALLSDKSPYGDCFKMVESFSLNLRRGSEVVSDGVTATHWFAKNVGKVKMSFQGRMLELSYASIKGAPDGRAADYDAGNLSLRGLNQSEPMFHISKSLVECLSKM